MECLGDGDVPVPKTLEVSIPEGVESATVLKFAKFGRVVRLKDSLVRGDLFLEVKIKPDPSFVRNGDRLSTVIDIPFAVALAGGKVSVRNPLGVEGWVSVPKACKFGHTVQVPKLGLRRKPMDVTITYLLPDLEKDALNQVLSALGVNHGIQKD
jgi:molecular chaperone DnaJ